MKKNKCEQYDIVTNRAKELLNSKSIVLKCTLQIKYTNTLNKLDRFIPQLFIIEGNKLIYEYIIDDITPDDVLKINAGIKYCKKLTDESNETHLFRVYQTSQKGKKLKFEQYQNSFGTFDRPIGLSVFMNLARDISLRSTCLRRKVGAVITDSSMNRVLCFGYNGNYANGPNECDSLEPGLCGCVHAEINALTKSTESLDGSKCFITLSPCVNCAKTLINRGVKEVIYDKVYRDTTGLEILKKAGVSVISYNDL